MTTYKSISQYAENSRYFYDPSSVEELQGALRNVYVHVKQSPKDASGSLFEIFDKNIRQLLKNLLVYRSFNQELEDFQRTLVLFESIINKSSDKALARRYLERCRFASEVIGDRINELSADKSKLVSQQQVRVVLALIAKAGKVRQKFIQDNLEVSKQRTSNILRQMRAANLIDAVSDEYDKRERSYVLTEPGKIACAECNISLGDHSEVVPVGRSLLQRFYEVNHFLPDITATKFDITTDSTNCSGVNGRLKPLYPFFNGKCWIQLFDSSGRPILTWNTDTQRRDMEAPGDSVMAADKLYGVAAHFAACSSIVRMQKALYQFPGGMCFIQLGDGSQQSHMPWDTYISYENLGDSDTIYPKIYNKS